MATDQNDRLLGEVLDTLRVIADQLGGTAEASAPEPGPDVEATATPAPRKRGATKPAAKAG